MKATKILIGMDGRRSFDVVDADGYPLTTAWADGPGIEFYSPGVEFDSGWVAGSEIDLSQDGRAAKRQLLAHVRRLEGVAA